MPKIKKYKSTNIYNWEVLGDNTHLLWVRKIDSFGKFSGNFIQFSYYPSKNEMSLDQGIHIHCESFDEANFFVSKVLRIYRYDIPEQFTGRYHKLKKIQQICHSVS